MSNLQTDYHFELDFHKVGQHTGGNRLINWKAWNSPVEYCSRECKHGIQGSEVNMFNPICKENVQARKHPGSCAFVEPELLGYRKPKRVFQNEKNGHKIHNTIMMKIMMK